MQFALTLDRIDVKIHSVPSSKAPSRSSPNSSSTTETNVTPDSESQPAMLSRLAETTCSRERSGNTAVKHRMRRSSISLLFPLLLIRCENPPALDNRSAFSPWIAAISGGPYSSVSALAPAQTALTSCQGPGRRYFARLTSRGCPARLSSREHSLSPRFRLPQQPLCRF